MVGAIVGAVVATIITAALVGRSSATAAAPIANAEPPRPCPTVVQPPPFAPVAAAKTDDTHVQKLAAENAQQAAMISSNPDGVLPAPYPADLPDAFRERAFRGVIEAALRECMPESKLAGVSCEEPPCVAVIALRKPATADDRPEPLDRCAAWKRVYGRESRTSSDYVDCGDGRKEQVLVISPELETWDGWKALDDESREHIAARVWPRTKNLLAGSHCAPATASR